MLSLIEEVWNKSDCYWSWEWILTIMTWENCFGISAVIDHRRSRVRRLRENESMMCQFGIREVYTIVYDSLVPLTSPWSLQLSRSNLDAFLEVIITQKVINVYNGKCLYVWTFSCGY